MQSFKKTYSSMRNKPPKVQIAGAVVIVILIVFAIGIPLAIRPSVDFGVITEKCSGPMTDDVRLTLLQEHNRQRSIVAKGEYKIDAPNSALKQLPPATRMIQLGNYPGAQWYKAGKTLSECNKPNEAPHASTGLCELLT
ncbi:hypothetical protein COOONC_08338 [Cooperia oncophora]